jgi:hypothetical protein
MINAVNIEFDCLPLRSLGRIDLPVDAPPEDQQRLARLQRAAKKHGLHNTYYLLNGCCAFRLTNHDEIGMVEFVFEGTVLTDAADQRTVQGDLAVELQSEICEWLTPQAVEWLAETVTHAVKVEFDRYIAAGDLQKTIERIERLEHETEARGGFLGMGL